MKLELQNKIKKDFPDLCSEDQLPSSFAFGFECGNGWYDLIYKLCKDVSEVSPETKIVQVKEKFGELRFYVNSANNKAYELIDEAERKSREICEVCGSKSKVRNNNGWLSTICDKCKEK